MAALAASCLHEYVEQEPASHDEARWYVYRRLSSLGLSDSVL